MSARLVPSSDRVGRPWLWLIGVFALLALAAVLTYGAGGTKTPLPHAFYIPVVLAAVVLGVRAGLSSALIAGVACGPLMPLDIAAGQLQQTSSWLIRLGFFLAIAAVVGTGRNRLLHLSSARQEFLSTVSHELRTPIASVVGFASVLADQDASLPSTEREEFARLILKEATELANVVDHYVLEGRLDGSALFIESAPTDLRRIIDIVLEGVPRPVREARIQVKGAREVVCHGDPLRLRQILRSIINNALAYTSGDISVSVTADRTQARVRVSDRRKQPRRGLRRRRPQPVDRNGASAPPLGIGLALSRDLARRMGGELQYQVNGTIQFELRLPLHATGRRRARVQALKT